MTSSKQYIDYKRSRFFTRLPKSYLYTPSHFWIQQQPEGWRVGYSKFALRMLGDIVEYELSLKPTNDINIGEVIGWLEGFKATTDIYCIIEGQFIQENSELADDPSVIYSDPYNRGWLYEAQGTPDPQHFDVHGYIDFLDKIIDRMLQQESIS